ncbi:hypothetical protein J7E70_30215 [Variovorax paradoxus]|nr:hypothetical protein [Variovorax paradoxus]MBT2304697.1 hypothetical protein [Variovorax paradoxus]
MSTDTPRRRVPRPAALLQTSAEAGTHGGARPGAGRPRKTAGAAPTTIQKAGTSFQELRAQHEKVKLEERQFKLAVARGQYVERAAVRNASAELLAALAQGLRSLPDNLERKLHLPADVTAEIEKGIDACLADVSEGLRKYVKADPDA